MRNSPAPDSRARKGVQHGFTLIEMLVVVLILGLIGAIVVARGPFRSVMLDLRGAGQQVAASMRQTRLQAIRSGTVLVFTIDPARLDYGLWHGARHALPTGVGVAAGPGAGPGAGRFVFYPDGSAAGGGAALVERGRLVTLRLNWLTGAIVVEGP
ncbi:prepilin-type N-terminal cleavage/methylation domain-containing protein [Nguyenibacter sp. L1]|uniref:pilus assembly FimT family protein n=1 Tax=Nguyenibacter sp. L1 TaxID=3049350 RepID=UPI002B47B89D|nr:prepilin-type N-terminal cleavage/methylation domain-containing protein [Nguyenibacter sp. L1]WRH88871.1 prepilin-type N-terminal cleavage/methylation domain-containing protein [Nguyenibacter sp. L1]